MVLYLAILAVMQVCCLRTTVNMYAFLSRCPDRAEYVAAGLPRQTELGNKHPVQQSFGWHS